MKRTMLDKNDCNFDASSAEKTQPVQTYII